MGSRNRPAARSWEMVAALFALPFAAGTARGQATETLEARDLGERGVVFESPILRDRDTMSAEGVGAGDVDGDGLADIVLALREDAESPHVFLLIRGRGGLWGRHEVPGDLPGTTVFRGVLDRAWNAAIPGRVGDIDGDSLADIFLGCPYHPNEESGARGAGFLVFGSRSLAAEHTLEEIGTAVPGIVFRSSDPAHEGIGKSVVSPGDLNGDGRADLVVSAPFSTNFKGQVLAGIVFVLFDARNLPPVVDLARVGTEVPGLQIHGNPEVLDPDTAATLGYGTIGFLGYEMRPAGDVDGDGLADILIAEPDPPGSPLYLFRGRRDLPALVDLAELATLEYVSAIRSSADGFLAGGFGGVGDLDGDGLSEVLIGFPRHSFSPMVPGNSVAFLLGGGTVLPSEIELGAPELQLARTTFRAIGYVDLFGSFAGPAGDLNSDGIPDLAIGATWASPGGKRYAGEAYVIFGKRDIPAGVALSDGWDGIRIVGEDTGNELGAGVFPAGDFDGDGAQDLLVMTSQAGFAESHSRAYVIYGTGSGPAPLRLYRVEPPQGRLRGGETVRIRGSGFANLGAPRVLFGGSPAPSATVRSGSEVVVSTPPGATTGRVDVTVEFPAESRTLAGGFEYTPDFPEIDLATLGSRGLVIEPSGESSPGSTVSFGDLNGDGVDDLAVGSGTPAGWVVTIVRGGPGLPPTLPAFEPAERSCLLSSEAPTARSVARVAFLGDVDGDGLGDLGIGVDESVAWILLGRPSFPATSTIEEELFQRRAVRLERSGPEAGVELLGLGDQDGDGLSDFAAVVPGGADGAGEILVVRGRRAWPEAFDLDSPALRAARVVGSEAGHRLGEESAAADLDGDGTLDLLLGTEGGGGSGRAYVVLGGSGLTGDRDVEALVQGGGGMRIDLEDGFEHSSWLHVARAGDTDGDGSDDLLLGVEDGGESSRGATYLLRGGRDLPRQVTLVEEPAAPDGIGRVFGERPQVQLGRISPAGDFDADGLDDWLVAQQPDLATQGWPWKLFLVLGTREDPGTIRPPALGARCIEIAGNGTGPVTLPSREAGDLNGDGQPDFAVRAWPSLFDPGPASLHVVFGPFGGTTFLRGDANFDSRIEISDAIFTLAWLFLGGEAPRCVDAVDADDSGSFVLTDAVYILNHLFLGGPQPPPPYPGEGPDPTEDELACRGF